MVIYDVGDTMDMANWVSETQIESILPTKWVPTYKLQTSVISLNRQHWGPNRCVRFEKMAKFDVGVKITTANWAMVIPLQEETMPMKWVTIYPIPISG